jgi:hypothetical protein
LKILFLFCILFIGHDVKAQQKRDKLDGIWLNSKFIKCLSKNLLCDCEQNSKVVHSFSIEKGANFYSFEGFKEIAHESNWLEFDSINSAILPLKSSIVEHNDSVSFVSLIDDTLIYSVDGENEIYIRQSKEYKKFGIMYFEFLTKLFQQNNYNLDEEILDELTSCGCTTGADLTTIWGINTTYVFIQKNRRRIVLYKTNGIDMVQEKAKYNKIRVFRFLKVQGARNEIRYIKRISKFRKRHLIKDN